LQFAFLEFLNRFGQKILATGKQLNAIHEYLTVHVHDEKSKEASLESEFGEEAEKGEIQAILYTEDEREYEKKIEKAYLLSLKYL